MPLSCSVTLALPDSHQRMTQVWTLEKTNPLPHQSAMKELQTSTPSTHTQCTVLQICRLYRKEGKLSGTLEVFSNISLPPPVWERSVQKPTTVQHRSCLSEDFWTGFRCFDYNTILRFLDLWLPQKIFLTTHSCSVNVQCKLHSDSFK